MLRTRRAHSQVSRRFRPWLAMLEAREVPAVMSWDGGATGLGTDWTDAANWAGDKLPGPNDEVSIGSAFAGLTITHSSGTTVIQKLTSDAAITIDGGTLALAAGSSTINNTLAISAAGTLELRSATLNGTVNNQGLLRGLGSVTLNGPLSVSAAAKLQVEAQNQYGNSSVTLSNGFVNNGTIELICTSGAWASTLAVSKGTLTNAAGGKIAIQTGTGGGRNLNAALDNQGTITIDQPLMIGLASADHVNTGTIVANADVTVTQNGTTPSFAQLAGTLTLASGKTWSVNGGTFDLNGGAINGPGSFKLSSGTMNYSATATLGNLSALAINSSTVSFTPDFSNAVTDLSLTSSTFNGPGKLTNVKTLDISGSTINTQLHNQGTLIARGTTSLASLSTNASSALLIESNNAVGNTALTVANSLVNNGTIDIYCQSGTWSSTLNVSNGTLTNASAGKIAVQSNNGGARNLNAQLDNQGTITIDQPLTISRPSADHTNNGTITINADVTITQGGTSPSFVQSSGTMSIAAGKSIIISSGTFVLAGGAINGPGSFKMTSGVLNQSSGTTLGNLSTLSLTSTTCNLTPDFTNASTDLILNNSTFNGPGVLTNVKVLDLNTSTINTQLINQGMLVAKGTSAITSLSTAPGSTVRVESNNAVGNSSLTLINGTVNNGNIELISSSGIWTSSLAVTKGTLTNAANGKIDILTGAGGARGLNAQMNNLGTITINQPVTINVASADHSNSGTMTVNADLTITQSGTSPSFAQLSGSMVIAAGKSVNVSGGVFDLTGGAINGPGSFNVTSGVLNQSSGGAFNSLSSLTFTNTTCNIALDFTNASTDLFLSSSTYNGPGVVTNTKFLDLISSTINTQLINQGTLVVKGTSAITTLSTVPGSTIRVESSNAVGNSLLTLSNGWVNQGSIELTSPSGGWTSSLSVTKGALTNASGGIIAVLKGAGGGRNLNAQLNNQGTITIDQPMTINSGSADHVNSGSVLVNADLTVTQTGTTPSFTQASGLISIADGKKLDVSGGVFDLIGGKIDGAGSFKLNSAVFNHPGTGTLGNLSQLYLSSSTANFTPDFTNAATDLVLNSSTFNGPGTLTNVKTLALDGSKVNSLLINQGVLVAHGSSEVTSLSTASDSAIHIEGNNAFGNGALTVANGFTSNGTIELISTSGVWASSLNVSLGTLANPLNGNIIAQPGAGGNRNLNAQLDNQGRITADQSLTINQPSAQHKNSGVIHASGGNIQIMQSGVGASFHNLGTLQIDANRDLNIVGGSLSNLTGTTLTGGTYAISGKFHFPGANIVTNAATISLNGPASGILDQSNGKNALANLAINSNTGRLSLLNDRAIAVSGGLVNAGEMLIGAGCTLAIDAKSIYDQTSGLTTVDGTLDAGVSMNVMGGTLAGSGIVAGNVNNSGGIVAPGTTTGQLTVIGNYTQSGTGQLKLELNGPTAAIDYDRLNVAGQVALGGTLAATVGYKSVTGENFVIMTNDGTELTSGTLSGLPDNGTLTIDGYRFRINYNGGDGNDVVLTRLATGIDNIVIDDGSAQRSQIRYFTVTFNAPVTLPSSPADAFVLERMLNGSPVGNVIVTVDTSASTLEQTIAKLTFSGPLTQNGSLIDGRYTLSVLSAQLLDVGGQSIDADNDGTPGGVNISNLHRLFGDADGNAIVDALDFAAFRNVFGTSNTIFDFNGDGLVGTPDFGQFRSRFGVSI